MVFQVLELKFTEEKQMTWKKFQSKMSDDYRMALSHGTDYLMRKCNTLSSYGVSAMYQSYTRILPTIQGVYWMKSMMQALLHLVMTL
jgi:hypothetical protein